VKLAHLTLLGPALLLGSLACRRDTSSTVAAPTMSTAAVPQGNTPAVGETATGAVVETMDASSYTYARVKTATGEIWAAGPQTKVTVGERITVPLRMPMTEFHSSTLNRTFPKVYFMSRFTKEGEMPAAN
jgi:hypothetical protein